MKGDIKFFKTLSSLILYTKANEPVNPFPKEDTVLYEWIDYKDSDGKGRLTTSNWSFYFYRGQTRRFIPCRPALFRNIKHTTMLELSGDEKIDYLYNGIKLNEFVRLLDTHPSIKYANEIGLHTDKKYLAQHYGIKTEYLDITENVLVAAFFASHWYDGKDYRPIIGENGYIYRISPVDFFNVNCTGRDQNPLNHIDLIGKQTIPRPTEQQAWIFKMELGEDFEDMPVELLIFERNKSEVLSLKLIFANSLHNENELSEATKRILANRTIAEDVFYKVFNYSGKSLGLSKDEAKKKLEAKYSIDIGNYSTISFSESEMSSLHKKTQAMKKTFLKNVGFRAVDSGD